MLSQLAQRFGCTPTVVVDAAALKILPAFKEAPRGIVLMPDLGQEGSLAEIAIQLAETDSRKMFFIYISDEIAPDQYKRLLRTNTAEWTRWDTLPQELSDAIKRLSSSEPSAAAKVVTFCPSKGGVGNTTLAVEVAVYLASKRKRSGGQVALVDFDFDGGSVADALDIEPRFDIYEIAGRPERLDDQLVDIFATRHSDRLDIFVAPPRKKGSIDIDPNMVFAILDRLSRRYELILIDVPSQRLSWLSNLLQGSDVVIITGASTVPAIRKLNLKLDQLDDGETDGEKAIVVVNQCECSLLNRVMHRKEISQALLGRQVFFVRQDIAAVRAANNSGRPLMELFPRNRVSGDIRVLADWIETSIVRRDRVSRGKVP